MGVRLSYIGSTMRKLLTDTDYNTLAPNTDFFDPNDPASDYARLPYYPYGTYMDIVENKGEGQLHALQVGLTRRWRSGLAFDVVYTYAHSDTTVPDSGNSTIGVVLYDPRNPLGDRGPDPNVVKHRVVANATWDIPVGQEPQVRLEHAGLGEHPLRRVDGVHHLPGPERPQPDAVLLRLHLDEPLEHGQGAGRPRATASAAAGART